MDLCDSCGDEMTEDTFDCIFCGRELCSNCQDDLNGEPMCSACKEARE